MKNTWRSVFSILVVIFAFSFLVWGCSSKPKNVETDSTEITYEMNAEDTITIHLEENGTTGYTWQYTIEDADIIEFVSDDFEAPGSEDLVGQAGVHTWVFKAIGKGSTQIGFALARVFEQGVKPVDERIYQINVQ